MSRKRKPVAVLLRAEAEYNKAAARYYEIEEELGERYLRAVQHAFAEIQDSPARWPRFGIKARRILVKRPFPFSVVYYDTPTKIIVIAVAHHKRKPAYWRKRRG